MAWTTGRSNRVAEGWSEVNVEKRVRCPGAYGRRKRSLAKRERIHIGRGQVVTRKAISLSRKDRPSQTE